MWAGLVSSETSFLGLLMVIRVSVSSPPLIRAPVVLDQDLPCDLSHLFKGPVSKYSWILRSWGIRTSTYECGLGGTFQPITPLIVQKMEQ